MQDHIKRVEKKNEEALQHADARAEFDRIYSLTHFEANFDAAFPRIDQCCEDLILENIKYDHQKTETVIEIN
jgi:hypothetical protein